MPQLNTVDGGINRQRTKGGASPKVLYDLVNGYVDASGTTQSRHGSVEDHALEDGTRGMCAFGGGLVVFASSAIEMPAGVTCEILIHPTDPAATLVEIHYAGPLMGFLYVVAEWSDGSIFHYWLQRRGPWEAETFYDLGAIVEPTDRNGFAYRAHRLDDPGALWQPDVARAVGDVVEPTTPNGYAYTVIETEGANPRSGAIEPNWPAEEGATINEDTDLTPGSGGGSGGTTPPTTLPPDVEDRYDNPGGNRPGSKNGQLGVSTVAR